jgi:purine-binding chemotaxis protein CheW
MDKLLLFALSDLRCALPLSGIERILRAAEISPLPKAPEIVMGLLNVQGRIIPVLNIRRLFHLPETELNLNDQIIIARTTTRSVAILVDYTIGVAEYGEADIIPSDELFPGIGYLEGVTKLQDDIIYIYNLDRFLSSEDEARIETLLSPASPESPEEGG